MQDKIILIHGPVISPGLNDFTTLYVKPHTDQKALHEQFYASATIKSNAISYRALGYKVIFSGWDEDRSWVEENSNLFDGYTIQNSLELQTKTNFLGKEIQNNKEKLYRSCLAGYDLIGNIYNKTSYVFRIRSDISLNPFDVQLEIDKLEQHTDSILIEYGNPEKPYFVPDFMLLSTCNVGMLIYSKLTKLCNDGQSYHISSHIDHGITFLKLIEQNQVSKIICMNESIQASIVWRGIPRYLVDVLKEKKTNLFFNCEIKYPNNRTSEQIINAIPTEFSGRRKGKSI